MYGPPRSIIRFFTSRGYTVVAPIRRGGWARRLGSGGATRPARNYYREFLRLYDRPVIGHRRLVEEAKTAMVRETGRGD
ncbi:MAG: hypothetical protein ACXWWK_08470 [Gemmatimonadales bacterium]